MIKILVVDDSLFMSQMFKIFLRKKNLKFEGKPKKEENTKKEAEKVLKAFVDVVTEEMKKGEKVQLVGFGTFEVSERAAREGRNPQTGKTMKIEACKAPKFKAGKALKDAVNA